MIDQFVILLKPYNYQDALNIPYFRDATSVGEANDKELLEIYTPGEKRSGLASDRKQLKSQSSRKFLTSSTPKKSLPDAKRRAISERKLIISKPALRRNIWKNKSFQCVPRYVHSGTSSSPSKEESDNSEQQNNCPKFSTSKRRRHFKEIKPTNTNLLDIIPPELEDIDLNILFKTNDDDCNQSDYDTVSCSSTDGSFYTCDEANEALGQETMNQPIGRPGQKLNLELLGPPSREVIAMMPFSNIYKCKASECGFTTSSSTNIKMHTCAQSRRFSAQSSDQMETN